MLRAEVGVLRSELGQYRCSFEQVRPSALFFGLENSIQSMAGNLIGARLALAEPQSAKQLPRNDKKEANQQYEWDISWRNVIVFIYLHGAALNAIYLSLSGQVMGKTILWYLLVSLLSGFGITVGAHRLWAHKAYKATWQLRLILAIFQTLAFQNHIYEWVRDHRVHHKFTDTDADPHNAQRGFFFSHMGWLIVRKHEDVKIKGATVDMSDLEKDPIVVWQRRLYVVLMPLIAFVLPTWVPYHFWGESLAISWYWCMFRYSYGLHSTWLVNSAAHIWGNKPYDLKMSPSENTMVALAALGEGWHNYHHVFPWDYKAAELGNYSVNISTLFIDTFAKIGWAYDLRSVSPEIIKQRAARTGDGTLRDATDPHHHMNAVWGWDDKDISKEDMAACVKTYPSKNK